MSTRDDELDDEDEAQPTAPVTETEAEDEVYPKLTRRQARFVEHYLTFFNNLRAAIAAGYSPAIKPQDAYRIRKNANVSRAIRLRLKERQINADAVLARLSDHALARYSDYLRPDGSVDLDRLLADGMGHMIKRMRQTKEGLIEIEWHDSQAALVHLAKIQGLMNEKEAEHDSGPATFRVVWENGPPDGFNVTREEGAGVGAGLANEGADE